MLVHYLDDSRIGRVIRIYRSVDIQTNEVVETWQVKFPYCTIIAPDSSFVVIAGETSELAVAHAN